MDFTPLRSRAGAAAALLSLMLFMSAVLVTRLPAASGSLSAGWVLLVALGLGSLSLGGSWLLVTDRANPLSLPVRLLVTLFAAGTAATGVLAAAALGEAGAVAVGSVAALLFLSSGLVLALRAESGSALQSGGSQSDSGSAAAPPSNGPGGNLPPEPRDADEGEVDFDQSWRRWREGNLDVLEGCVRATFESGQATAVVHIPLQPAMSSVPSVECEPADGAAVRIMADPVMPFGVRLVCRRGAEVVEKLETMISVRISATAGSAVGKRAA